MVVHIQSNQYLIITSPHSSHSSDFAPTAHSTPPPILTYPLHHCDDLVPILGMVSERISRQVQLPQMWSAVKHIGQSLQSMQTVPLTHHTAPHTYARTYVHTHMQDKVKHATVLDVHTHTFTHCYIRTYRDKNTAALGTATHVHTNCTHVHNYVDTYIHSHKVTLCSPLR